MKTLTLTQPWATLVAIGAKRFETRYWATKYRGPLAIHAAKGFPPRARDFCRADFYEKALIGAGYPCPATLPIGCVIATCELTACVYTEVVRKVLDAREIAFGDYTVGRYAFELKKVRMLPTPIPAKGAPSLWEWDGGPSQLDSAKTEERLLL